MVEVIIKELPEFLGLWSLGIFLLLRGRASRPSPSIARFSSGSKHNKGGLQSRSQCFSLIAYFFVLVVVSVVCVALSSPKTSHNCPSTSEEVGQRQFPAPDFEQMNEVAFSFSGSDSLSHSLSPSLKEITQRLLIFAVWSIAKVGGKFLAVCWKLVGR